MKVNTCSARKASCYVVLGRGFLDSEDGKASFAGDVCLRNLVVYAERSSVL